MLSINRPTPTTVLYTVSTRSPTDTWPSRFSSYLLIFVRILAGLFAISLAWSEYVLQLGIRAIGRSLATTEPGRFIPTPILLHFQAQHALLRLAIIVAIFYFSTQKFYQEESLLVLRGLGVQTTTQSSNYLSRGSSAMRFIPTSSIQDIFIHEAFKGFEVRFYLAIVVEGEAELRVVFPNILPRREMLETVWRGTRACLYEPTKSPQG
ncbi:hypothetical protein K431DRAFT_224604 [Polychaeton citri CBS 116435]|uniref:Phosphatidylinositol N-acetylglucosaminyltransferase subunit H conserved domain-containing protein n=1 Tax=Polychaeton citri CBS 116435 TaxID=1314669 RepID=A0A9P4Q8P3_9PEZI|nr:hypothetical protein K431DRAFT_224604 [Polychaeton citri CBS 116435]